MKLKKTTLIFVISSLLCLEVFAQTLECGTVVSDDDMELLSNANNNNNARSGPPSNSQVRYFPVRHHIVSRTDGTGGLSSSVPKQIIRELNEAYRDANIQFYSCASLDRIKSDAYYDFSKSQESSLRSTYNDPEAINVYYFNSVKNSIGNLLCGYATFPTSSRNFIGMSNSCATNGTTIVHEFGHFFGLLHTHETKRYGEEFVERTNCLDAGDLLCDTPADPELSTSNVNSSCTYTGTTTDPNSDTYSPDTRNYMSYSRKACRDRFSRGQEYVASFWANSTQRQSLDNTTTLWYETIQTNRTISDDVVILDNVTITNNSDVIINACELTILERGFQIEAGSTLRVE